MLLPHLNVLYLHFIYGPYLASTDICPKSDMTAEIHFVLVYEKLKSLNKRTLIGIVPILLCYLHGQMKEGMDQF